MLVFSTVQPVIFVLMFRYVFGGAIHITGVRYVDYLMPGIFIQTVTFQGAVNAGVGLAEDLQEGAPIERFRSLAMARSAVLAGRTIADAVRNLFVIGVDGRGSASWSDSTCIPTRRPCSSPCGRHVVVRFRHVLGHGHDWSARP